jgi:NAD(P)-dependent dehydrogenase (short-subunit alcohol dehydrogenase family)
MRIEGSSAIVVGGASGLGEATARHLHNAGAAVTIADVNAEKGQTLATELGLEFAACDVRDRAPSSQAAVTKAAQVEGGLRIASAAFTAPAGPRRSRAQGPPPLMPFETILRST